MIVRLLMIPRSSSLIFLHYLTTVFDNISDAIMLIGVEPGDTYRLLLANDAFIKGTGHSQNHVGKLVDETVSADYLPQLKKHYKRVIKTKQPLEYTEWYTVPLGRHAYEVKLIPILNAVGECVQIAAITRDVTELHNLRKQLRDATRKLEEVIEKLRDAT